MPAIVEFPTLVQEALAEYGYLFSNDPERRLFASSLTGLFTAKRKTVSGINCSAHRKGEIMSDYNQSTIDEFRANNGKVGGYFAGANMLLLHTVGAKSNKARTIPLIYVRDGDRLVVIASKGGADSNPDWYYNLLANPSVTVELGTEQFQARATAVTEEPERSRLYAKMVEHRPGYAEYEKKTRRKIPAIILERVG
jgi:deazaflavin-dependent oxidoreductase (nitroreductase family)